MKASAKDLQRELRTATAKAERGWGVYSGTFGLLGDLLVALPLVAEVQIFPTYFQHHPLPNPTTYPNLKPYL